MDEEVVLDLNQIRAVRVLGRGAMASVFLVSAAPGSRLPTLFARRARWELSLLSRLSAAPGDHHHPFLPSLLGSVETPDLLAWAIPFCPGGDLHALRRSLSPSNEEAFSADAIRFYLSEIVTALAHLHSMRVAYRDLKPENVLLRSSGHIMLADFDLSRHLPARSTTHSSLPPPLPSDNHSHAPRRKLTRVFSFGAADDQIKKGRSARVSPASRRRTSSSSISKSREGSGGDDERSFSFVGTEEYVAPEVVRGEGHGFAVDWWALGILAYEMAYGQTPFRGRNRKETLRNILTLPPMFPGRRRTDLTDIIERLVVKDPERRLGFSGGVEEVKAHPFFDGVKWELLPEVARPPFLAPVILPFFLPFLLLSNLLCEEGTKIEGFRGVEERLDAKQSPAVFYTRPGFVCREGKCWGSATQTRPCKESRGER
ncbi:serine/threonine-protein kinase UCN-like [Zingiber officinale]|uniref:serine/threonine-protein kinase UCN-like n=1 Tax=Zingiber officinale TaxID=94328 RepID=UPI001C4BF97D|nr:serine/threonine-protein kinase UCN-like [Zingiber officinale]